MLIGFVQGYEDLKWRISKLNPLCNVLYIVIVCSLSAACLLNVVSLSLSLSLLSCICTLYNFMSSSEEDLKKTNKKNMA